MTKIKILQLVDGDFLSGRQINALSLARNLDKNEFDVTIAAKAGGKFEREAKKYGVRFLNISIPKVLRSRHLKELVRYYKDEQYDIIHSHGSIAGFYSRILRRRNPAVKVIHSIHGINYINSESYFYRHSAKAIEQYLVQFTDMTICVSRNDMKEAAALKILNKNKTVVIPEGIDLKRFSDRINNGYLRKEMGLSQDDFVIGNISRFNTQKNQKLIVQSAYYLVKKFDNMKFILVGNGDMLDRIKDYVFESGLGDHFIFTGEVNNPENYYHAFDIFVFPSLWEGAPAVLLEAMASGLPVICSDLPELREIVKNNYSALLIDPSEPDDIINKISVLYKNKELREQLVRNANVEIRAYNEHEMIRKTEKVYKGVLRD